MQYWSATNLASSGWLLPVRSFIEFVVAIAISGIGAASSKFVNSVRAFYVRVIEL